MSIARSFVLGGAVVTALVSVPARATPYADAWLGKASASSFNLDTGAPLPVGSLLFGGQTIDRVALGTPEDQNRPEQAQYLTSWYGSGGAADTLSGVAGMASSGPGGLTARADDPYTLAYVPGGGPETWVAANSWTDVGLGNVPGAFLVAPHSKLVFSADYHIDASIDVLGCHSATGCQMAGSGAGLYADGSLGHLQSFDFFDLSYAGTDAGAFSRDGTLTLTLINDSDHWRTEQLSFQVSANAFIIPGIPEPGTWALMACGLGALGWRVRRRRG